MKKVIILGGGVAGMSAAHELINRGFEVEVYERQLRYAGGKARSVDVPGTAISPFYKPLPGEHGFRFFPGFYKHITDTMKHIPFEKGKSCFDNLVPTKSVETLQIGKLPIVLPVNFPSSYKDVFKIFESYLQSKTELTEAELHAFTHRIWQLMTSCSDRFLNEYEQISWWEFMEADKFSNNYRSLLVEGLTRSLVAAKAQKASTKTVGTVLLQLLYLMINPTKGNTDCVLNGPTNDVWLNPWLSYLTEKGVKYVKGKETVELLLTDNQISGALIRDVDNPTVTQIVTGDYYLLAVPVEVAAKLITPELLKADASLKNIIKLAPNVEWMNGIQFYLTEPFNMHRGHTIYANSNWALTSISQIQFWQDYDIGSRFDGTVKGVLSVDISDWTNPGNFNKKAAQDCTIDEVKEEVWKQLKQEINSSLGHERLRDDMLRFVHLDSDIYPSSDEPSPLFTKTLPTPEANKVHHLSNKEPLLVNQVNTWTLRPNSYTAIPNLFLASDYIKTNTDLATMEGANEAARRAVNNIIMSSGLKAEMCKIWKYETPLVLKELQLLDKKRFDKGLAWKSIIK
ncbi:MAG: FAD-dependent oxidoreductase [Bacteroidia bacterium]